MRALLIALLAGCSAFANAASPIQQKLKPIGKNLAEISALLEQLTPGQTSANWEDPRIPGLAADRKQALTDVGCHYDIPDGSQQPKNDTGIPTGRVEVGGAGCPVEISMDISGVMDGLNVSINVDMNYKLKDRAAFPDEDVAEVHSVLKLVGAFQVDEAKGLVNIDLTGQFLTNGVSFSQGAFKNDGTTKVVLKLNGFNLEMNQDQENVFSIGQLKGTFRQEIKGGFFGAEEKYYIDGKEISKEEYRESFGEYQAPFFSLNALNKAEFLSACRVELFPSTVDLAALTAYAETGAAMRSAPLKQLNACGSNMEREAKWDGQTLQSRFTFGKQYLMIKPTFISTAGQIKAEPFYALYEERQSRIDKAGDNYMVFICEPVKTCP